MSGVRNLFSSSGPLDKAMEKLDTMREELKSSVDEVKAEHEKSEQDRSQDKAQMKQELQELKKQLLEREKVDRGLQECMNVHAEVNGIQHKITVNQLRHDKAFPRPCGDWLPCGKLFTPHRSMAREEGKNLLAAQLDLEKKYPQCFK